MNCKRCGVCCSSAFFAMYNRPIDEDTEEIARWILYHGCEPMRYPTENGDVLAIKIPIPCEHLGYSEKEGYHCKIYETRPVVCKNYFCKKVKDEGVLNVIKENGIRI